jgi:magnesium chelatase family protein
MIAPADLEAAVMAQPPALVKLKSIGGRLGWSARALHRCLRVARTIADLQGSEQVSEAQVTEAAQYRRILRPLAVSEGHSPPLSPG